MASEMVRFKSQELPEDRQIVALIHDMVRVHPSKPFSGDDPRANVRRVVSMAENRGLPSGLTIYRGELGMTGLGADHVRLSYKGCVIDPSYPLLDDGFGEAFRDYMQTPDIKDGVGHIAVHNFFRFCESSPIRNRPFGVYPDQFTYLGQPVWMSAQPQLTANVRS